MNNRINWVDMAKGIGIILVLLGHNSITKGLEQWIFSFHMPLFFFLSGLFFNYTKYLNFSDLLRKKSYALLVPYFIFSALSYLYWYFIRNNMGDSTFNEPLKPLLGIFYSAGEEPWMLHNPPLWFLTCLFMVEIIFFLVIKFTKNIKQVSIILISFSFIGYLSSIYLNIVIPWSIDTAITATVFFGLGYFYKKYKQDFKSKTSLLIIAPALIVNLLFIKEKIDMSYNYYGNFFNFYIAAISGILVVILMSQILPKSRLLMYLGQNSLIIFALHLLVKPFVVKPLDMLGLYQNNSVAIGLIVTLLQIIIIIPICYFLNKYTPFVLGKKKFNLNQKALELRG
ncbi:acyltransferase family protein [Priestia megaterium]